MTVFSHIVKIEGNDKYIDDGPPYLILLHPALGLLWEVTRQKVNLLWLFQNLSPVYKIFLLYLVNGISFYIFNI